MTKKFKTGFVVGKFAPFHNGHKYLIDTALDQSQIVFVLSYTSENFPKCDWMTRKFWLETTYKNEIEQGRLVLHVVNPATDRTMPCDLSASHLHRQYCVQKTLEYFGSPIEAVFASETYGLLLAGQFSPNKTEFVMVDEDREKFPISGTKVRELAENDYRLVESLVPEVTYATLIPKILVLGGESSGKTTLVRALTMALKSTSVMEYGRARYDIRDGKMRFSDMEHIVNLQLLHENKRALGAASRNAPYVICDTSELTTYFYSMEMFGHASPNTKHMAVIGMKRYDHVVLCDNSIPFVQDGTRRDAEFRSKGFDFYKNWLDDRNLPYQIVTGSVEQRINSIKKNLEIC